MRQTITSADLIAILDKMATDLEAALTGIQERGMAQLGDRTILLSHAEIGCRVPDSKI